MGFLTVKTSTLDWEESKAYIDDIKQYGIYQAINLYNKFKGLNKKADELKWGEEIEYEVAMLDHKHKNALIHAEGFQEVSQVLKDMQQDEFIYQEEFGSWMVEAVPTKPYTLYDVNAPKDALSSLIRRRRNLNDEMFMKGLFLTSLASFPNLGNGRFFSTENSDLFNVTDYEAHNEVTRSKYVLDEFTNPHPRFPTMMKNIRKRRGKKVDIRVPLYQDENTGVGKIDGDITPGEIYMDAQHFGMGC